jgi:NUMOD4 motif
MRNGGELRIWRPIPGYEGYFIISDQGDIRAKTRIVKTLEGPVLYKGGLQQRSQVVNLNKEGRSLELLHNSEQPQPPLNNRPTDEVILRAFRGPPLNDKFTLKHLDGDPNNYSLSNLVWTTPRVKLTNNIAQDQELELLVEQLGPEIKPDPGPPIQLIQEPIEGWINRYLARHPVPEEEPPEFPEWQLVEDWETKYNTDVARQNNRILKLRSRLQGFYEQMQQLEDELNYQIELLEYGLRYQIQQLEGEFNHQLYRFDGELRSRIQQLEDEIAVLKAPPPRVSKPRLRLTDDAAKSLSKIPREKLTKIPRERLTDGIQILFDRSA